MRQDLGQWLTQCQALAAFIFMGKCSLVQLILLMALSQLCSIPQPIHPSPAPPFSEFRERDWKNKGRSPCPHSHNQPPSAAGTPGECCPLGVPCSPHPSEAQLGTGNQGGGLPPSPPSPGDALGLCRMGTSILSNATQKPISLWL